MKRKLYCEFMHPDGSMCMSARRPEKRRIASYGYPGEQPRFCASHKMEGMGDVSNKICKHASCDKHALFGIAGERAQFCKLHKAEGMTNVASKRCAHDNCKKHPAYALPGESPKFCNLHKTANMIDVVNDRCAHPECQKQPSYGKFGGPALFCVAHKEVDMIHYRHWRSMLPTATSSLQSSERQLVENAMKENPLKVVPDLTMEDSKTGHCGQDWANPAPMLAVYPSLGVRQLHTQARIHATVGHGTHGTHCIGEPTSTPFELRPLQPATRGCFGGTLCAEPGARLRHLLRGNLANTRSVHMHAVASPGAVGIRAVSLCGWVMRAVLR